MVECFYLFNFFEKSLRDPLSCYTHCSKTRHLLRGWCVWGGVSALRDCFFTLLINSLKEEIKPE